MEAFKEQKNALGYVLESRITSREVCKRVGR